MPNSQNNTLYTTEFLPEKMNSPLKKKFVRGVIFIIVPILGLLFTWIGFRISNQGKQETIEKARVIAEQIVLTRQWITDVGGGVYVDVDSTGAKGVKFAIKNKIITKAHVYQFFTPSMVTQKLSQYSFEKKSYQFRLSSLTPLNLANHPNAFETKALQLFKAQKITEHFQFTDENFDYIIPLYNKKGCTKCHTNEEKTTTSIIGGLRVTIPYGNLRSTLKKNVWLLAGAGLCITLVTITVLIFFIHTLILKPLNELEEKSRELSSGNLGARVSLDTNDELERLGKNFNQMAQTLMQDQDNLEEKIARATNDLAQANLQLLKLDKLKSDFLANMSHELRTPLTAVKGSINYLERTLENPDHLEFVSIIGKNISRLTRLIANLFDFTKLEAGAIDWEFSEEDLIQLIRDVIEILSPLALEKKIDIQLESPQTLHAVIDFERIEQVLVNLIDNAIKFSRQHSTIQICLKKEKDVTIIHVKDQGCGIDKENLDTIFKKFYTAANGSADKNQGAGMGLAISKAIINAHNGSITVESEQGKGSTFTIRLPGPMSQTKSSQIKAGP